MYISKEKVFKILKQISIHLLLYPFTLGIGNIVYLLIELYKKNRIISDLMKNPEISVNDLIDFKKNQEYLKVEVDKTNLDFQNKKLEADKLITDITNLTNKKAEIQTEIDLLKITLLEEPIEIKKYIEVTSEEIKTKLQINQQQQKEYQIKTSNSKTGTQNKNNIKQLLRSFNLECDVIIKGISAKNSSVARSKITSSYNQLNNLYKYDNVALTDKYLKMKLEELTLYYSYIVQKENENEDNRARRAMLLEEEKAEKERDIERQKIEKDLKQHNSELNKLLGYMNKSNDEIKNQIYVDKIKELEEEIKQLKEKKEKVNSLDNTPKAGYVYIISNIGTFGENVYKIGMTRRLEPLDRIKELSDASVPFPFDVHALIFSTNAPELENILHNTFKDNQLNKMNNKKEFYKVNLKDIKDVVIKNHNATVEFIDIPEAIQYRESIK